MAYGIDERELIMFNIYKLLNTKYTIIPFSLYFLLGGLIILDRAGLQIALIRQIVGVIFLLFIPGYLILKSIGLCKINALNALLYSVGLSISFLMFVGLFMNTFYPFFGILRPISTVPLLITIGIFTLVLCILISLRTDTDDIITLRRGSLKVIGIKKYLLVLQLPFLSIIGTHLFNFYGTNLLILISLIIISLIPIFVISYRPSERFQAFTILMVSIFLLYHTSLLSMYLWGTDVHREYHLATLVIENAYWDPAIYSNVNAMLSIVILAPILSEICNMDLTWVFKIIYPLIYALIPLGLYRVYQNQTDDRIAFLSVFFFVSIFTFYIELPQLARQEIAELFFVLLMMLIIDKSMDNVKRAILSIIFAFSLAISHYGTSYIFMLFLVSAWLLFYLSGKQNKNQKMGHFITSKFVVLYITFAIAWYIYVSSSSALNTAVKIGNHVISSIFTDFLSPGAAEGLNLIVFELASPLQEITRILHFITIAFITVGIIVILLKRVVMRFEKPYIELSLACYIMCLASIALPYFASAMNTTRMYHISLLFIAPFCIIGGSAIIEKLYKIVGLHQKDALKFLSIFFSIFLIFNSGVVYELLKDPSGPIFLCKETIIEYGDSQRKAALFYTYNTFEPDVAGIEWLSETASVDAIIYSDYRSHPLHSYGMIEESRIKHISNVSRINKFLLRDTFLFLGYPNTVENILVCKKTATVGIGAQRLYTLNTSSIYDTLPYRDAVYTNGKCEIYMVHRRIL